jgi:competence protein ComEC
MRYLTYFTTGYAACLLLSVYAGGAAAFALLGIVAAVCLLMVIFRRLLADKRVKRYLFCAFFGAVAAILALFVYDRTVPARYDSVFGTTTDITAVVLDHTGGSDYYEAYSIEVLLPEGGSYTARMNIYKTQEQTQVQIGDRLSFTAELSRSGLEGESELQKLSRMSGGDLLFVRARGDITVAGSGNAALLPSLTRALRIAAARLQETLASSLTNLLPQKQAALICAVTVGDRRELSGTTEYTQLQTAGIAHIVAVSGMHVSILVGFISVFLKNRRARVFIGLPVIIVFMAVCGFSKSVTRAVLMQALVLLAPLLYRKADGVTSVAFAVLVITAINPYAVANIGFQLSCLSTLGILLFAERLTNAIMGKTTAPETTSVVHRIGRKLLKFVCTSFAVTVSALVFTLPLCSYYFGYISTYSLITNLLALPAVSVMFCCGLAAAALGALPGAVFAVFAKIFAFVAGLLAKYIFAVGAFISSLPFASVYVAGAIIIAWLVFLYVVFALHFMLRGSAKRIYIPAACAALSLIVILSVNVFFSAQNTAELAVLDVGQGQCIAVTDGSSAVFIDCGALYGQPARTAEQYLQEKGIVSVTAIILTHAHTDHASGVPALLASGRVGALIEPNPEANGLTSLEEEILTRAGQNDTDVIYNESIITIQLGSVTITVFPPLAHENTSDENEICSVIIVSRGDWEAVITGDMPSTDERQFSQMYNLPDCELFIAGHHGSKYANSWELLTAILPENVIISVGANNSYGHPTAEALARFTEIGAQVYRTDENGNVTVQIGQ